MKNYGVVLKKIRNDKKISLRQAANLNGRSIGWLSEVENSKERAVITENEFKRIAQCYGAGANLRKYQLTVARMSNYKEKRVWFEGGFTSLGCGGGNNNLVALQKSISESFERLVFMNLKGTKYSTLSTNGNDPLAKQEFALLYLMPYLLFILAGGGKHSIDRIIDKKLLNK